MIKIYSTTEMEGSWDFSRKIVDVNSYNFVNKGQNSIFVLCSSFPWKMFLYYLTDLKKQGFFWQFCGIKGFCGI